MSEGPFVYYYYRHYTTIGSEIIDFQILKDNRFYKVSCLRIKNSWVVTRLIGCLILLTLISVFQQTLAEQHEKEKL